MPSSKNNASVELIAFKCSSCSASFTYCEIGRKYARCPHCGEEYYRSDRGWFNRKTLCLSPSDQCREINTDTGHRCSMADGHAGPHVVGSPYRPDERWVTPCQEHDFMPNRDRAGNRWDECWKCGERRSLSKQE